MERVCFILASSEDRVHLLNECVTAAKESRYSNNDFYLYFQGRNTDEIEDSKFFRSIIVVDRLRGVFTPRYELMKRFSDHYDYTIVIDDDLFIREDTNYERGMSFLDFEKTAGAVAVLHNRNETKNEIRCVSGTKQYFNVCGGLILPKRSVDVILDYFSDKEQDYTEDVFWLLLYVKGYDLYKDFGTSAKHKANRKVGGKLTGYNKMREEKPHVPMLTEWFDGKIEILPNGKKVWKLKEMEDINTNGILERERNYRIMRGQT